MKILKALAVVCAITIGIFLAKPQITDNTGMNSAHDIEKTLIAETVKVTQQTSLSTNNVTDNDKLKERYKPTIQVKMPSTHKSLTAKVAVKSFDPKLEEKIAKSGGNPDRLIKPRAKGELDL